MNTENAFNDLMPGWKRIEERAELKPMINIIKKMFEANPGESTIVLKEKCSQCRGDVSIELTPTPRGFGLQGGALFKCSPDAYVAKCLGCYTSSLSVEEKKVKGKKTRPVDV